MDQSRIDPARLRAWCGLRRVALRDLIRDAGVSASHGNAVLAGQRTSAAMVERLRRIVADDAAWRFITGESDTLSATSAPALPPAGEE